MEMAPDAPFFIYKKVAFAGYFLSLSAHISVDHTFLILPIPNDKKIIDDTVIVPWNPGSLVIWSTDKIYNIPSTIPAMIGKYQIIISFHLPVISLTIAIIRNHICSSITTQNMIERKTTVAYLNASSLGSKDTR